MKRKNDRNKTIGLPAGAPDLERRKITKLIGALALLGMGLGVNLDEVFAADQKGARNIGKAEKPSSLQGKVHKPEAEFGKVESPSVTQDKYSGAGSKMLKHDRLQPQRPGVSKMKWEGQKAAPAKPGVSIAKPVPAKPGVSIAKPVPANKPTIQNTNKGQQNNMQWKDNTSIPR